MKRVYIILIGLVLLSSCVRTADKPYDSTLFRLSASLVYPEGFEENAREGVSVMFEEVNLNNRYVGHTDADGRVSIALPNGLYRLGVSDRMEDRIFNGALEKIVVNNGDVDGLNINLVMSKAGAIVFKEIYSGGCKKLPYDGDLNYDSYVIVHNNNYETEYLDGLCFGSLAPYNSTGNPSPFVTKDPLTGEMVYPDFVPVVQAVWQIGGDGTSFPLEPGEDAVIVVFGAVDHTETYPRSVNLNKPDYFVCYSPVDFPMESYHPVPGTNIKPERHLSVIKKMGIAKAYTFSKSSPAAVLFRAPEGVSVLDYINGPDIIIPIPGDRSNSVAKIPEDWVVDAVEVFSGASATNNKRLQTLLDAGNALLSETNMGHTVMRKVDETASSASGYEVLADTNNSTNDFYERETQSLHE